MRSATGCARTNRRVYAVGDVAGAPQFTHVAGYHAALVIRALLFRLPIRVDPAIIPRVTFTDPELAQVGMSEAEAAARGIPAHVLRWPYSENDRARAERRTEGHIKVMADRRGRILGASIVGANAGEMIGLWALAIGQRLTLRDMAGWLPPYPTMGEIGRRAAIAYFAPMTLKAVGPPPRPPAQPLRLSRRGGSRRAMEPMTQPGAETAPRVPDQRTVPLSRGLSTKLLLLTILFVLIAEVLIFLPSIANFRLRWLEERLSTAAAVSVVLMQVQPGSCRSTSGRRADGDRRQGDRRARRRHVAAAGRRRDAAQGRRACRPRRDRRRSRR